MSQICPASTPEVREGETLGQCHEQGIRSEPTAMGKMRVRVCRSDARKGALLPALLLCVFLLVALTWPLHISGCCRKNILNYLTPNIPPANLFTSSDLRTLVKGSGNLYLSLNSFIYLWTMGPCVSCPNGGALFLCLYRGPQTGQSLSLPSKFYDSEVEGAAWGKNLTRVPESRTEYSFLKKIKQCQKLLCCSVVFWLPHINFFFYIS